MERGSCNQLGLSLLGGEGYSICIFFRLCIIYSLIETMCLTCSAIMVSKMTNHRPGVPFTLDVVCWEQRGVFLSKGILHCNCHLDFLFPPDCGEVPIASKDQNHSRLNSSFFIGDMVTVSEGLMKVVCSSPDNRLPSFEATAVMVCSN